MFQAEGIDEARLFTFPVQSLPFLQRGEGEALAFLQDQAFRAEVKNEVPGFRLAGLELDAQSPRGDVLYHAFASFTASQSRTAMRSGRTAQASVRISSVGGAMSGTMMACMPAAWAERMPL